MRYRPYKKAYLETIASDIRRQFGKSDGNRLMVDHLVEKMGFKLFAAPGLKEEMGVEAYLPAKEKTIIVDRDQMDYGSPRFNFTLVEEVAHNELHRNLEKKSAKELHECVMALSGDDYLSFERDAKYLAGAILMDKKSFTADFHKHFDTQKRQLGASGDRDTVVRYTIRKLYMAYCVSFEAAAFRALSLKLINAHDLKQLARYRPAAFSTVSSVKH